MEVRKVTNMTDRMIKRAHKASLARLSVKVVKRIDRCDVVELNRTMKPIIYANELERIAGEQAVTESIFC